MLSSSERRMLYLCRVGPEFRGTVARPHAPALLRDEAGGALDAP